MRSVSATPAAGPGKSLPSCFPLFFVLALASVAPIQAQEESRAADVVLTFSRISAKPGETVNLPVYLTSDVNVLEPFLIQLAYAETKLTFLELRLGRLAERAQWQMQAEVVENEDPRRDENNKLLEIRVRPGESDFFPSGAVAFARFEVSSEVKEGDILMAADLKLPDSLGLSGSAEPGKITVYTQAIYGCFFYMH